MSRWQLIIHGASPGAWNMGVDEALLARAIRTGRPTLRFYRWRGPWLSLGYAQRVERSRLEACDRAGVGVVRRATGGRAVLHGSDLTYSLAAREGQLPAGLIASYERVAGILVDALSRIGVAADLSPLHRARSATNQRSALGSGWAPGRPRLAEFDCFARPAAREICVEGRKLAGSAQRRARGGILQHGSIRLAPDPAAARLATTLSGAGATSLAELGACADPETLLEACVAAFGEALGGLDAATLGAEDLAVARERAPLRGLDSRIAPPGDSQTTSRQPLADR